MSHNLRISTTIFAIIAIFLLGCNKNDSLNSKPNSNLTVPSSLADCQALLDNSPVMNNQTPALGDASSDNYYMTYTFFQGSTPQLQGMYVWAKDIFQDRTGIDDWNNSYSQIFYTNIILESLNHIKKDSSNTTLWNNIQGSALFIRAFAYYNLAQIFAPVYDSLKSSTDMGLPIRLASDINSVTVRSTVQETYDQILSDLSNARVLISNRTPTTLKNRPSLSGVFALFAKTYLSMRKYNFAGLYADSSLKLYGAIVDLNTTKTSTSRYLPYTSQNNDEVIYNTYQTISNTSPSGSLLNSLTGISAQLNIDSILFRSYSTNDLRKSIYYSVSASTGATNLNGSYGGVFNPFSGLATNELYLIRAECNARAGNITSALSDLNALISKRWRAGTVYIPLIAATPSSALNTILTERRKELPFSNVRWTDLRRLNMEGYNITLSRLLNGQLYSLPPNDPKYTLPIPPDVIQKSGIPQNPR